MTDFQEAFGIRKTGPHTYQSNHKLMKPHPKSRGVYGGNLAGQALLVAIKSAPDGFTPHSLHSFFVKSASDTQGITWVVEENSNGKSFCNRTIKAVQEGETKYIANVSLTKKNSVKAAEKEFEEYEQRRKQAGNEDDEDDEPRVSKPFTFQTPYPSWLTNLDIDKIPTDKRAKSRFIFHKVPQQMFSLEDTKEEDAIPVTERKLSFYVRLGDDDLEITDPAYQFVGMGVLSDSLFLTRLARVMRISTVNLADVAHYFSVSLDHIMYFHDVDFDCTKWMGYGFKAVRLVNNRVLLEGEMYSEDGKHVATIIQEGLVHFNGLEKFAKL